MGGGKGQSYQGGIGVGEGRGRATSGHREEPELPVGMEWERAAGGDGVGGTEELGSDGG